MFKKLTIVLSALVLSMSLFSCGSTNEKSADNQSATATTEEKIDFKAAYDAGLKDWGTDSEDSYKVWVSYDDSSLTIKDCGTMFISLVAEPILDYFGASTTWEKIKSSSVADGQQEDVVNGVNIWWKINMPQNDYSQKTVTIIITPAK